MKVLLLSMAVVMTLSVTQGCKKEVESNVSRVSIWTADAHSKDTMLKLVNDYNNNEGKEKEIEIEYTVKEGNYSQIIELALASGQAPDFFVGHPNILKGIEKDEIVAIDDLPGGPEFLKKFEGYLPNKAITGGKYYYVPSGTTTYGLIYNKDLFKKAGLVDSNGEPTPPKTFAQLREYAKILTNVDKDEYGFAIPLKWGGFFGTDLVALAQSSYGIEIFDPVKGEFDFNGLKSIMEMYLGIKEDGSYFPGAEGLDNDPARAQFAQGRIAMKFAGSYDVGVLNDQFPAKCDWGVAPYPVEKEGIRYGSHMDINRGFFINKKSMETVGAEKLFEVLKWTASDELLREMYKNGKKLPYNWDMVKDVKVNDTKKGWVEFSKLTELGYPYYEPPKISIENGKQAKDVFLEDVWTGKVSVDDAIRDLNKRYNESLINAEKNGVININNYKLEKWNNHLK